MHFSNTRLTDYCGVYCFTLGPGAILIAVLSYLNACRICIFTSVFIEYYLTFHNYAMTYMYIGVHVCTQDVGCFIQ